MILWGPFLGCGLSSRWDNRFFNPILYSSRLKAAYFHVSAFLSNNASWHCTILQSGSFLYYSQLVVRCDLRPQGQDFSPALYNFPGLPAPPRAAIKNHQIPRLCPRHQKSSKPIARLPKNLKRWNWNQWNLNICKNAFLQHLSHRTLVPQTSWFRRQSH